MEQKWRQAVKMEARHWHLAFAVWLGVPLRSLERKRFLRVVTFEAALEYLGTAGFGIVLRMQRSIADQLPSRHRRGLAFMTRHMFTRHIVNMFHFNGLQSLRAVAVTCPRAGILMEPVPSTLLRATGHIIACKIRDKLLPRICNSALCLNVFFSCFKFRDCSKIIFAISLVISGQHGVFQAITRNMAQSSEPFTHHKKTHTFPAFIPIRNSTHVFDEHTE